MVLVVFTAHQLHLACNCIKTKVHKNNKPFNWSFMLQLAVARQQFVTASQKGFKFVLLLCSLLVC